MSDKNRLIVMFGCIGSAIVFIAIFVVLAYQQTIIVPYLTPTIVSVDGLQEEYDAGGIIEYNVKVTGYGSNCHSIEAKTLLISDYDEVEVYFFKKADDCKHMAISYGEYNYTRAFRYGGEPIIGKPGTYKVTIDFADLGNNGSASAERFFKVPG